MTRGIRSLTVEEWTDIFLSAKEAIEQEKADIEAQRDNLSGILYLEKISYVKGKLHAINAVYDAVKTEKSK